MSLMPKVEKLVRELGAATVDDLMPQFPGYTRKQIIKALQNCRKDGRLTSNGRQTGSHGNLPATYYPAEQHKEKRFCSVEWRQYPSVFHYAQGLAASTN